MTKNVFFYLSGEHPALPEAEVKAILQAEGIDYAIRMSFPQVLRLSTDLKAVPIVGKRAGMTHVCGEELFSCNAKIEEIREILEMGIRLPRKGTFEVRVRRILGSSPEISSMDLERLVGRLIERIHPNLRVQLEGADHQFLGLLTSDKFVFGLVGATIPAKTFEDRRPSKRPFFHPSALIPKFARCMVNLARPRADEILLDPFCGTGGLSIEGELIGCKTVSSDIDPRMVRGCKMNLAHYGMSPESVTISDARRLPFLHADAVATDTPFRKSTKTFGASMGDLVADFLSNIDRVLPRRRFVCLSAPQQVRLSEIGVGLGLYLVETYLVYVHRRLTREICVFRR